ncbi:Glutathione S-transferase 4 [Holothuria leucospilota]|uniref:Glutathione S-transferase 4 n=1 Tax=Holothuria leucospilota TaxID=206669 RepID=A0A9Q1BCW3_HOLLE|nr:Glutathione S-transferase 4 [Holothuria leucospilota]
MPTYNLTYFNMRARAEPVRFMSYLAGVDYEDLRVTYKQWKDYKASKFVVKIRIVTFYFSLVKFVSIMPTFKLIYFKARARAEPIRYMFHLDGVEYEDIRVSAEQWKDNKIREYFNFQVGVEFARPFSSTYSNECNRM